MAQDQVAAKGDRLLPVYVMCDTSSSMEGEPIAELNKGLEGLIQRAVDEGALGNEIRMCIISFGSAANVKLALSKLSMRTEAPRLEAGGVTRLDLAIEKLSQTIDADYTNIIRNEAKAVRPVVFIFTDGVPTDAEGHPLTDMSSWQAPLNRLKAHPVLAPRIYAFGFKDARASVLNALTADRDVPQVGGRVILESGQAAADLLGKMFSLLFRTLVNAQGVADASSMSKRGDQMAQAMDATIEEGRQGFSTPVDPGWEDDWD